MRLRFRWFLQVQIQNQQLGFLSNILKGQSQPSVSNLK